MVRVASLALAALVAVPAASCRLDEVSLTPMSPVQDVFRDASPDAPAGPSLDAAVDASHCAVDRDGDGACADADCDDLNPRRSPLRREYCPDKIDNDCDELVDFDDTCDTTNDRCGEPVTVLTQDPDIDPSSWTFDLPLPARYQDDVSAGLSGGGGDCGGETGAGGGDAVFQIAAATDATFDITARGVAGPRAVLILREVCSQGQAADICDVEDQMNQARLTGEMDAQQTAWLIVDDDAAATDGIVRLEVHIAKQVR